MGQFSWLDCKNQSQILIGEKSYVLVPGPFRHAFGDKAGHIEEPGYDGYGHFGGHDIYELAAHWNREKLRRELGLPDRRGEKDRRSPGKYPDEAVRKLKALLAPPPRLEDFSGMYGFEKEELLAKGMTAEQVEAEDLKRRESYFSAAVSRYGAQVARLEDYLTYSLTKDEMEQKYGHDYLREIGIDIACYDEQNAGLPYPIEITHDGDAEFDRATPSLSDGHQGIYEKEEEHMEHDEDYNFIRDCIRGYADREGYVYDAADIESLAGAYLDTLDCDGDGNPVGAPGVDEVNDWLRHSTAIDDYFRDKDLDAMDRISQVFEDAGIKFEVKDEPEPETGHWTDGLYYALAEFWTDTAGQDIPVELYFDGTAKGFAEKFREHAESYDVDEEVKLFIDSLGERGVPSDVSTLLADCREAKDTLMGLASKVSEALARKNVKDFVMEMASNDCEAGRPVKDYDEFAELLAEEGYEATEELFFTDYDYYYNQRLEAMIEDGEQQPGVFGRDGFIGYMEEIFGAEGFEKELIEGITDYGIAHNNTSKDQLAYFLSDVIQVLTFGEAAMFCPDSMLTANGIAEKRAAEERAGEAREEYGCYGAEQDEDGMEP